MQICKWSELDSLSSLFFKNLKKAQKLHKACTCCCWCRKGEFLKFLIRCWPFVYLGGEWVEFTTPNYPILEFSVACFWHFPFGHFLFWHFLFWYLLFCYYRGSSQKGGNCEVGCILSGVEHTNPKKFPAARANFLPVGRFGVYNGPPCEPKTWAASFNARVKFLSQSAPEGLHAFIHETVKFD